MLTGKLALVTGASRGIGRAVALDLAKNGADVIINYMGSKEKAQEVVDMIQEKGQKAYLYQCDVSKYEDVQQMVEKIKAEVGTIDILVNNAGINRDTLLMRMKEEEWDQVLDTNLKSIFNCSQAILRDLLKKRSGKIVNISSVVALSGNIGQTNYAASKAGIIGFTKSLAREVASRGIQVNAVAPGFIDSDMTRALPEKIKEITLEQIPLKKFGQPEDIANAVSFLVSPKADYITGQVISVNGGMYI